MLNQGQCQKLVDQLEGMVDEFYLYPAINQNGKIIDLINSGIISKEENLTY